MAGWDHATDRTADLMRLGDCERWTVIRTERPQSVAEHSFNVAVIVMELADRLYEVLPSMASVAALYWALIHDAPECLTGDVDGKFKRDNPEFRDALVAAEQKAFPWYKAEMDKMQSASDYDEFEAARLLVKLADKIEAIHFISEYGRGGRADDVRRELEAILFGEWVHKAAAGMGVDDAQLSDIVLHILHHSVREANCVQQRRHRSATSQHIPPMHSAEIEEA